MKSRLRKILPNLALAAGTFLFCFVALEVVLRIAGFGNVEIYQPDPLLYWKLKPNQDCFTKIDHKPVHINSLGTRGPEFDPVKPTNTIRVLSLGDSKTFGWGLSEPETYSVLLEKKLQEYVGPTKKVEVINAGVNAWSYAQMYHYFREYGLKYSPDILLLADANLWTQFSDNNSPEFVKAFMQRVRLKNFLRRFATYHYVVEYQLKEVYERTRSRFVPMDPSQDTFFKEQQKSDPDAFFRTYIERACALAQTNNVKPLLIFIPSVEQLAEEQDSPALRAKKLVSQQLNVPLLDLTPELKPEGKALFLEGDSAHLNARGNVILAERLYQSVTNLIAPSALAQLRR